MIEFKMLIHSILHLPYIYNTKSQPKIESDFHVSLIILEVYDLTVIKQNGSL